MDRAYAAGAAGTPPSAPGSPSAGYPTSGNAGTGTPATKPGAYWYHMVMEELMNVITSAGITPALGTLTQLKQAMDSLYGGKATVGSICNGKMSVAAASATATFTADEVVVETALGGLAYRLASFNKTINLGTTGAGGMDTGAAPVSGYVALYAIYNPTTQTAALLAVNATAAAAPEVYGGANMPAGYTASALVSVWPTNGSGQFKVGYQRDRKVSFPLISVINSVTAASYTAASLAAAVPKNAIFCSGLMAVAVGSSPSVSYAGNLAADVNGTGQKQIQMVGITGTGGTNAADAPFSDLPIITAQTAYYSSSNTPGFSVLLSDYVF